MTDMSWLPTSTMATEFYRLPNSDETHGELVGPDAVSAGGDQSAMRMVNYVAYVCAERPVPFACRRLTPACANAAHSAHAPS